MEQELQALQAVLSSLEPLDGDARQRVLEYALKRFGYSGSASPAPSPALRAPAGPAEIDVQSKPLHAPTDIRSLKEIKKPKSAIEMAVLVGFFLSEVAAEKQPTFGSSDLTQYFKMAGYPLAKGTGAATLRNAKNAGYLDAADHGSYKLNAVGYNLVEHRMQSRASGQ